MRWIVVGGGAAGCAVASKLVTRPGDEVLLLEAGPATGPGTGLDGGLDTGPRPAHPDFARRSILVARREDDPPAPYAQGFGVGGGSLINGGIVTAAVPSELVGVLPVERPWALGPVGAALLATDASAAEVSLIRRNGQRITAAQMLLTPSLDQGNLTIVPESLVARVVFAKRRAVGVVTESGREHLGDAVVVCAGAINTPILLLRSGVDTSGVGVGLQDHPSLRVTFDLDPARFDASVPAISVTVERGTHQIVGLDHMRPDMPLGVLMAGLLRVESRGSVTLPGLDGPPQVTCNMLATDGDRQAFMVLAADLLSIARSRRFREVVGPMYIDDRGTPIDVLRTDSDLVEWAMSADLSGYHHVSATCQRGVVTDADGWVHGYERLAVADASLFTVVPASDPYIAVVAQALRLVSSAFLNRFR